jgi:hypothetical protein
MARGQPAGLCVSGVVCVEICLLGSGMRWAKQEVLFEESVA